MKNQAERMQEYLESPFHSEDEESIIKRMEFLSIMNAKSGQLMAECKRQKDKLTHETIRGVLCDPEMAGQSASIINKYVDSKCSETNGLYLWFDRINSASAKQIEALRSILSYRKQQQSIL